MPNKLKPRTITKRRRAIQVRIQSLHDELVQLMERCSHVGTIIRDRDPSGGSDTGYCCCACGAWWKRWPEGVERYVYIHRIGKE